MIKKIDRIILQIFIFLINSIILISLIVFQFFRNIENPNLILFFYILLISQILFTFFLAIKNLINKKIFRGVIYFIITSLLGLEIYFTFLFVGVFSFGMGTSVGDDGLKNFRTSNDCKEFDKNSMKIKIENISKNEFAEDFNKDFIEEIKKEKQDLPKKINKINCGCRKTDSTIIVFRIWGENNDTYELEMEKKDGKWKYKSIYPATFF